MRVISLIITAAYCVGGSSEEGTRELEDDVVELGILFDDEGEFEDLTLAACVPPSRRAYMEYTPRHWEVVSEIVAGRGGERVTQKSMFEEICMKLESEGLAPMPFGTFYSRLRRIRPRLKRVRDDENKSRSTGLRKKRRCLDNEIHLKDPPMNEGESSSSRRGKSVRSEHDGGSSPSSSVPRLQYSKEQIEILEETIKLHPEMGLQDLYEIFSFFEAVAGIQTPMKYSTFCSRATRLRTNLGMKTKSSGRCRVGHFVSGLLHEIKKRRPDTSADQAREELLNILHEDEIPATKDIAGWLRYHRDHMMRQL